MEFEKKLVINEGLIKAPNLVDRLSDADLAKIGFLVYEGYERDLHSRHAWERRMEAGMDLAMQIQKDKNFPWQGCSNVIFPLITIAALQFSARSYSNIVQGTDVVRYRVVGEDPTGELRDRADRISKHMSWQVLEEDLSWEEQHDRLLINLGIVGTNFIKTYFSPRLGHNVSELVLARDFVLDYYAKSVESCARKTHVVPLYRNEIYERCQRGVFCSGVLDSEWFNQPAQLPKNNPKHDNRVGISPPPTDLDTPFRTLEQHRLLDLDDDGYAEPYIVTIEESSKKVLRIVARFDTMDAVERKRDRTIIGIKPTEYFTKYSFIPAADGGIYDIGFGVLLGPLNEAVNSGINQLLDSGTMQNSIGGFLGRGAKIRGGVYTMAPWEWKRVDSTGDDLRKNMVPFPERQPSLVMYQLLNLLIGYTERMSGATDIMVGLTPGQNTPAETSRNALEQGMQIYNVIFKRVWRSMKEEFKKLHALNAIFLEPKQQFGAVGQEIRQEDYKGNADYVVPVADPNLTSPAQRMQQATMLRQAALQAPGYDMTEVEKNFLRSMRIDGIDKFYPGPDKVPPPPNPMAQIKEGELKLKQMDLAMKQQQFQVDMLEQIRLNTAKIMQLQAQAYNLMKQAGGKDVELQLSTLDMAIKAIQAHNDMMEKRMKFANETSEEGNDRQQPPNGGTVQGVAQPAGNGGIPQIPTEMAGESEGTMG